MMKKILFPVLTLLSLNLQVHAQSDTDVSCSAEYDWKVNDSIMMFAPGMAVNFSDRSEGEVVNWLWDFGDGSFSEMQNPMHIFTFLAGTGMTPDPNGVFIPKVCLTITTLDSCFSTVCKTLEVTSDTIIYPDPECYLYFYPYRNDTLMTIPEVIPYSFSVTAPKNTSEYFWDFGDGTTSDEANPVHGFDFLGGVFNVCLQIVTEDGCINSYCAPVYINQHDTIIQPDCQAYYTYTVMESYPEQFAFQDLSMGSNPIAWSWDFGDGTYSNEQNPVHAFWTINDSLIAQGYLGPPIADRYMVCLTVLTDDNCKSTYCDVVYMSGNTDTIYPQPCPYFISLTTSNILGGNFCNGTASASLVDAGGTPLEAGMIYWSNGESGPTAGNLCVNIPYYVSMTGPEGCQVVGSFAIIDYTQPMEPFGYWTIYGYGSSYDLNYTAPDSGYVCNWQFSDGTILTGYNVSYTMGNEPGSVTLNVLDRSGEVVYTSVIALNQATNVKESKAPSMKIYPNPAVDVIHLLPGESLQGSVQVEIYNSIGQKLISERFDDASSSSEIEVSVSTLEQGIYFIRILGAGRDPVTLSFVK
ncbi:MAG: PKD domain-containing protein [Bacteroidales bacterium]